MKGLLVFLVLILAGYGAYKLIEPQVRPYISPPEPASAPVTVSVPTAPRDNECYACKGLGKLIDKSGVVEIGYACTICGGSGTKRLPANGNLCNHCKGMGKIPQKTSVGNARVISQRCPICGGSGISPR